MGVSITTNYGGEVLNEIITKVATGNEPVEQGHVRVETEIGSKLSLPRLTLSSVLQDDAATPTASGTATFTDRALTPTAFLAYLEWLPDQFKSYWRQYQPTGNLVFQELPQALQVAILDELAVVVGSKVGDMIWKGDTSSATADINKFNGLITRAAADSDVNDVSSPVALSASNIAAKIGATIDLLPYAARYHKDLKIFVSSESENFYRDYLASTLTAKGPTFASLDAMGTMTFKGIPVIRQSGMADDTIFATYASADRTSNLWFGIDWNMNDYSSAVLVDRVANNSDLYFAKMRMKADTQIAFGEHCALYQV